MDHASIPWLCPLCVLDSFQKSAGVTNSSPFYQECNSQCSFDSFKWSDYEHTLDDAGSRASQDCTAAAQLPVLIFEDAANTVKRNESRCYF